VDYGTKPATRKWPVKKMFQRGGFAATVAGLLFIVQISSAIFDCSAPNLDSCPDESLPEFAFIGRSNTGKSSLLNMLSGKDGLARTSSTPGFTKLINFFTMSKTWRLVDLPGYGFAEGAKKDSARFNQAVSHYLTHRPNLCLVFALIDSGLEPQEMDVDFVEWLARNAVPFVLVFTKTDKNPAVTVQANIKAFMERIAAWFVQPPEVYTCSATLGQGRSELLGVIGATLDEIPAESEPEPPAESLAPEVEPPFKPQILAEYAKETNTREKKRFKGDRPW
jgi:GTP-binding protein